MQYQAIGDLEFGRRADGSTTVVWKSRKSKPPRRLPFPEKPSTLVPWFRGISLLALTLAIVAVLAGIRLLRIGDRLWGLLALAPGLALAVIAVTFAVMVLSIRSTRRGDLIPLDPLQALKFTEAVAEVRQQLGIEPTQVDQQSAAVELWQLAWDLHQSR